MDHPFFTIMPPVQRPATAQETAGEADKLMSVTELAHQVGVSVRTIQYYDQMGLLSPNKKGPNNQRLYTEEEREQLYRILVLKYLGYPLKEIRAGAGPDTSASVSPYITDAMDKLEPEFLELFKRMATLRKLSAPASQGASWAALAHLIEAEQDNGPLYWQAMSIQDGGAPATEDNSSGTAMERAEVDSWHILFRRAMKLMQSGVPAESPQVRELARQYEAMGGAKRAREGVNLMITSMGSHGPMSEASFRPMIDSIMDYFGSAEGADEAAAEAGTEAEA